MSQGERAAADSPGGASFEEFVAAPRRTCSRWRACWPWATVPGRGSA